VNDNKVLLCSCSYQALLVPCGLVDWRRREKITIITCSFIASSFVFTFVGVFMEIKKY